MCVTKLDNIMMSSTRENSPHYMFYGNHPPYVNSLRVFGEMGIVTIHENKKIRSKLSPRGKPCIFVGYPESTTGDVYRMLSLETMRVIKTRDILWLNESYREYTKRNTPEAMLTIPVVDISESAEEDVNEATNKVAGSLPRELRNLHTFYNPVLDFGEELKETEEGNLNRGVQPPTPNQIKRDEIGSRVLEVEEATEPEKEIAAVLLEVEPEEMLENPMELEKEPDTFDKAWNHFDPKKRTKWREAVRKEFHDMNVRQVWEVIDRSELPGDRRCVKCKWVLKIKRNGIYRARLVACGYSQIPGVDFNEVPYSPVINDVTYRLLLVLSLVHGYSRVIVDVETAFLHGELEAEEEIYMECPQGMEDSKNKVLRLKKTIYGLVQAAKAFYKKLTQVLKSIGFEGGIIDPCLLTRKGKKGIVHIAIYVDDCFCCGDMEEIEQVIEDMKNSGFKLKIEKELSDYLSCKLLFSKDKKKAWIGQPHLLKKIETSFGNELEKIRSYKSPAAPGMGIVKADEDDADMSDKDKTHYRSGVGMLLFLVKHTRPDLANATRELSKVMNKPTPNAMKELRRALKYALDTKELGLKMNPEELDTSKEFEIKLFSDSDWAGDKDTRKSVTGYCIFFQGCAVSWKSKGQSTISLSSSEAELMALSEATKEIRFVYELLVSMKVPVKTPIICNVDNVGAIFMAENATATPKSKHIDIKAKFVTQFVADKFIKVIFVKSEDNVADIFTKNVQFEVLGKHDKNFIWTEKDLKNE